MKTKFTFLRALFIIAISCISIAASAQAPFSGPSDPSVPSGNIQQYVCSGGQILLKSSTVATQYLWYKKNSSGNMVLVQSSASNTYTETASPASAAGAGYYTYELQTQNASGCLSALSAPYNVFVLPPLTPTIAGTSEVCSHDANNNTSISLTASPNPSNDATYTYTYQWYRNGTAIPGATSSTYTTTETNSGASPVTINYTVTMAYTLDSACTATAAQSVIVDPVPATPTIQWN
jgi:hypothetical protein